MRFYLSLAMTALVFGCASAPALRAVESPQMPLPWNIDVQAALKPHLCHTRLTDLDQALKNQPLEKSLMTRPHLADVYNFRMSLRQSLSTWTTLDPSLSADCIVLSAQVQKRLLDIEQSIASWIFKNRKMQFVEQNVFMNSHEQLLSNPYVSDGVPVTSVSDLKSGDIVLATTVIAGQESSSWSLLSKSDTGSLFILTPISSSSWLRRSVHHPLSWLKLPANKVVIFRPLSEDKVQSALQRILPNVRQHESFLHQQRTPASGVEAISALFPNKAQIDPSLDPQFVQVLQWQNYSK